MTRAKNKLRWQQRNQLDRIAEGTDTDSTLRTRLKNRQKELNIAIRKESEFRQKFEMWDQRAIELAQQPKMRLTKYIPARTKAQKFRERAQLWERKKGQISQEIEWLEEQLRQIEFRKRQKEAEERGAGGSSATQHGTDSGGSRSSKYEFSVADTVGQQAGKFIGDRFRSWIKRTGDLIHKQHSRGLPQFAKVPGKLPGRIGVSVTDGILGY